MNIFLQAMVAAAALSAVAAVGILGLGLRGELRRRWTAPMVALALGTLLGNSLLLLLPRAYAELGAPQLTSLLLGGGLLAFYGFERALHRPQRMDRSALGAGGGPDARRLVPLLLLGDGLHNFVDGLLLGLAFLVSPALGWATALAMLTHELPQELGDMAVLLGTGLPLRRALGLNLLSALPALAGTGLGLGLGEASRVLAGYALPIAAANFLYIALVGLVPYLWRRAGQSRLRSAAWAAAGFAVMLLLQQTLHGGH
jgi:zinc and cadmium transporter